MSNSFLNEDAILDMAKEIGYAIQRDERFVKFQLAKEKNDSDDNLQKMMGEFGVARAKLNAESMKEEENKDEVEKLDKEVMDLYQKIMGTDSMKIYSDAKTELDELVRMVSTIVELSSNGMDPEAAFSAGCSPADCAGCSGCS